MLVSFPVFEKSCPRSPTLSQNGCQSHVCCGLSREPSKNFQKRNGKTCNHWSNVLMLMAGISNRLTFFAELSLKAASQQQAEGKAELQVQSFLRSGTLCHSTFISPSSCLIVLSMHVKWSAVGLFISWQKWLFLVMRSMWKLNRKGCTLIGSLLFGCHLKH